MEDAVRASGQTHVWGDEPSELAVDYTLMGLVDVTLAVTAWRAGGPSSGLLIAGTLAFQELIIRATKAYIARTRPEGAYSITGAYPSGHVANVGLSILLFLLVVLPLLRDKGRLRARLPAEPAFAALLIASFALYRVFAGEHWFTDVVGGAALALASALSAQEIHARMRTAKL